MKLLYTGPLEEIIKTNDWFMLIIVILFLYYAIKTVLDNIK